MGWERGKRKRREKRESKVKEKKCGRERENRNREQGKEGEGKNRARERGKRKRKVKGGKKRGRVRELSWDLSILGMGRVWKREHVALSVYFFSTFTSRCTYIQTVQTDSSFILLLFLFSFIYSETVDIDD